ncbi:diaminopimelate decarboxylase [Quisquiliibacterium transsilvanicum]|uniref:Diaminopimelate decarboxylase n=1 Tax=Quisquiliibacterium transsilvanicum TaxID=1549638 RepID=A0A7W8M919_9BURK|nr:diaminopimelate decarboxylase [Quisquiliibacterium transsilvanicum]MBB5271855.1 diaminopimelate decarboxylase [Quisquiliibacterium transsilvanicum]
MDWLETRNGRLHAEGVALTEIAERFGTPVYVYSRAAIEQAFGEFSRAAAGREVLVCYAMKANSNLAIIDLLARAGAGFDIVSGGELRRALAAGADASRVVFSGVGKSANEIRFALEAGVRCFNVESTSELRRLSAIATACGRRAPVSLRVNPDVDAGTHPYISTGLRENKFGIAHDAAIAVYREAATLPGIEVTGIDCHIGSQITELAPFVAALDRIIDLAGQLAAQGIALRHLDLGGGLGIDYDGERPPSRQALLDAVFARIDASPAVRGLEVMFEFGRSIVGNAGLLLTRVEYLKSNDARNFAVVDAAMNDLMRPALYEAFHRIVPVVDRPGTALRWDVVGPVCESGDWLGRDRALALEEGDLLAVLSAGAYGMAMSSNYNTRPRAAEVMVDRGQAHLIRERETVESLYALERRLPD